jgi:hypothetical protein
MSLNENLKTKLDELEAARDALDKTDIEAKLDELRREKDGLGRGSGYAQKISVGDPRHFGADPRIRTSD